MLSPWIIKRIGHLIFRAIITLLKVISIALFHFEFPRLLSILSDITINRKIIVLHTNLLFLFFLLM